MRTLRFIVEQQIIKQDPDCDFSGLIPGTEGYLKAEFYFSKEWSGLVKAAKFFSPLGREYDLRILTDGRSCVIPAEALEKRSFKIQVLGQNKESKRMITNKVAVYQKGGCE
jgi:hypothetical protein